MKKVGIATVYTGYNYGSLLQAFSVKTILNSIGYESELLGMKGSLIKGRDVRFGKLMAIILRMLAHPKIIKRSVSVYHDSVLKRLPECTRQMFLEFTTQYLHPLQASYRKLKMYAASDDYIAFVCGSDQIWNSANPYVDPFYYLRFAPQNKRIAFAPSFGRDYISAYNMDKIKTYVSEIPYLSVRESSGSILIHGMTKENVPILPDPTLVLDAAQWENALSLQPTTQENSYILAYFLSSPSDTAKASLKKLAAETGYRILNIPYLYENADWCAETTDAGPKKFLDLIRNAAVVCTDSFHGTAFSLNFKTPFYTYERNYGKAEKQSTRITSLLQLTHTESRLNYAYTGGGYEMDFTDSTAILQREREKSIEYLRASLKHIEENSK